MFRIKVGIFITLLAFCSVLYGFEDDFKKEIEITVTEYFQLLNKSDYQSSMDYVYPLLFDIVSREMFLQSLEQMRKDTLISMSFDDFIIHSISTPLTIDNMKYSFVNYAYKLKMVMHNQESDKEGQLVDVIRSALKAQFGEDNVDYDSSNYTFNISVEKTMFAISSPTYSGWKFVDYDAQLKPYLIKIIPQEIWSAFDRTVETMK